MKNILEGLELSSNYHTLQINTRDLITNEKDINGVKFKTHLSKTGELTMMVKINPSTYAGHEIFSLGEYQDVVSGIATELGISNYWLSRVDFKHDTFNSGDFDRFKKLNRVLILNVSAHLNLYNRYESKDFFTLDNLNIKARSERYEIENYNREVEYFSSSSTTNRLEMRSMLLYKKKNVDFESVIRNWNSILRASLSQYEWLQNEMNVVLQAEYLNELNENRIKGVNEFLRKFEGNIFTKKQLRSLLNSLMIKNPETVANNFSSRSGINYIEPKQLLKYINLLIDSGEKYIINDNILF